MYISLFDTHTHTHSHIHKHTHTHTHIHTHIHTHTQVYGDHLHHNDGTHMDKRLEKNDMRKQRWLRLVDQSAIWYNTLPGAAGRRFTACLAVEWRGVFGRRWNSEKTLAFVHVTMTQNTGTRQDKEIRERISRQLDLWEEGSNVGLVGNMEAKGVAREGRMAREEGDKEVRAQRFHDTVMSGNMRQAIWRFNARGGGGCLLPGDVCKNTGRTLAGVLQKKHPNTRILQVGDPQCSAFERFEEVPETVPL